MRTFRTAVLFLVAGVFWGCGQPSGQAGDDLQALYGRALNEGFNPQRPELIALKIGDTTLEVEIAGEGNGRTLGLMYRKRLTGDEGMWFDFPDETPRAFWMKNTRVPLSIAFVDKEGVIVNIEDMVPYDESRTLSKKPAQYALEMRREWFRKKGIAAGDRVEIGERKPNPRFEED